MLGWRARDFSPTTDGHAARHRATFDTLRRLQYSRYQSTPASNYPHLLTRRPLPTASEAFPPGDDERPRRGEPSMNSLDLPYFDAIDERLPHTVTSAVLAIASITTSDDDLPTCRVFHWSARAYATALAQRFSATPSLLITPSTSLSAPFRHSTPLPARLVESRFQGARASIPIFGEYACPFPHHRCLSHLITVSILPLIDAAVRRPAPRAAPMFDALIPPLRR